MTFELRKRAENQFLYLICQQWNQFGSIEYYVGWLTRMNWIIIKSSQYSFQVTSNFLCGALGSVLATVLWGAGGWLAVTLCGAGLAVVALVVWAFGRRGPLVVPAT